MTDSSLVSVADADWFQSQRLRTVLAVLNSDQAEARIVGGAVRNSLIGRPVGDIDIATTLLPADVIARGETAGMKAIPTGIGHHAQKLSSPLQEKVHPEPGFRPFPQA